jgi:hypothetical protein
MGRVWYPRLPPHLDHRGVFLALPHRAAAPAPALVQSASFGEVQANSSSRLNFRVQGWFCHDRTGGEVFVSAGAPLPSGVSCQ